MQSLAEKRAELEGWEEKKCVTTDDLPRAKAAEDTLKSLGYAYEGGEMWKPPLGRKPDFDLLDYWRGRAFAAETLLERKFKLSGETEGEWI